MTAKSTLFQEFIAIFTHYTANEMHIARFVTIL
jgi:hypothetical protein